ncbi:MAG: tetratricopeptide repeat protein [Phycisphaerales bacterium]
MKKQAQNISRPTSSLPAKNSHSKAGRTQGQSNGRYALLISVCLAAVVFIIYSPVHKFSFISFDDHTYAAYNPHVKSPLSFETLRWAFTSKDTGNWHPLTWLSLTLDYQLFKNWAGGYHLVNVFYHILNTIILFYLFKYMTNLLWASFFIAGAFALHPMHVESVAWIAERKDVLSAFFWLLTMLAYVKYVKNIGQTHGSAPTKFYIASLALFALGLMAKPMLVTLPFVLLLIDYWPLERKLNIFSAKLKFKGLRLPRLSADSLAMTEKSLERQSDLFASNVLIEKIPFFILSIVSSVITFIVQDKHGAMSLGHSVSLIMRIYNAVVSYAIYIWKMIWPAKLAILYPHPVDAISRQQVMLSGILLIVIIVSIIILRKHKFFAVGCLWFMGTLVPVIGIVQVGSQAYADRYTYIPYIGLFVIAAFTARKFLSAGKCVLFSIIILAAWSIASANQIGKWKNDETVFTNALANTKNNHVILGNYINYLIDRNRTDEAIAQSYVLLKMKPDSYQAHCNLGAILFQAGKMQEAREHFELAVKYKPDLAQGYYNLALVARNEGDFSQAISYCNQAIKLQSDYTAAYVCLGMTYSDSNNINEAVKVLKRGLEIEPGNSMLKNELEIALRKYETK